MYRGEAASLDALLRTGTIKVPKALKVADDNYCCTAITYTELNK